MWRAAAAAAARRALCARSGAPRARRASSMAGPVLVPPPLTARTAAAAAPRLLSSGPGHSRGRPGGGPQDGGDASSVMGKLREWLWRRWEQPVGGGGAGLAPTHADEQLEPASAPRGSGSVEARFPELFEADNSGQLSKRKKEEEE